MYAMSEAHRKPRLKEAGLDPAPERLQREDWKEFLLSHFTLLAAADFFSVEVWTALGLALYQVIFVIGLATREVPIGGFVPEAKRESSGITG